MTIMRVRRTLSETEIETHGMLRWRRILAQKLLNPPAWEMSNRMPVAVLIMLAQSAGVGPWRTQTHT
jgi:hypothetical protein